MSDSNCCFSSLPLAFASIRTSRLKKKFPISRLFPLLCFAFAGLLPAAEFEVVVAPRATVVEHKGITGGGHPVHAGDWTLLLYPNHPDDFGGSAGTSSASLLEGNTAWTRGRDDWPMPEMIDLWADRLANGDLIAMGLHWVPDSKKRREVTPADVPSDAYQIGFSKDRGQTWTTENALIQCPPTVGVIARPLPHIVEEENGTLLMPAYTWSKSGNSAVLLSSVDHGRHWTTRSVITTAVAMIKAGAVITTPWLESSISPTSDGAMLAIVRTGSTAKSHLVSLRSTDAGITWSAPEVLPFAGKLPTLHLLPNGTLTLLTALSKNHCRLYLSGDGTGRLWSPAHIITSLSGGNVGASIAGPDEILITTPSSRRINAWHVRIAPKATEARDLATPTDIAMVKGNLTWTPSPNARTYRVTPILIKPGPAFTETDILPYATIQTLDSTPSLELGRQLLPGSTYAFEISAVNSEGRISPAIRSQNFQL